MENKSKFKLLTPKVAAERLGISTSSLAKWRLVGEGPAFIKVGCQVRYTDELIELWITSRIRQSTSDRGKAA